MTTVATAPTTPTSARFLGRIIEEGYGAGAWHGPDLAAAISDVTTAIAFRRPAPARHNIAEVALHHAWCIRAVIGQLSGQPAKDFPLQGEDWFAADGTSGPTWEQIRSILASYQATLVTLVADIAAGRVASPLSDTDRFGLVLGVTCHAVYHAGQIQLVKRLVESAR